MHACPAAGALRQLSSGGEEPHSAAQLEPPDAASAQAGATMLNSSLNYMHSVLYNVMRSKS
jgi:hypothetical protein